MSVLVLLIGVSLTVALGFLMAFLWASSRGQYDDDYTSSVRMLFDDNAPQRMLPQRMLPQRMLPQRMLPQRMLPQRMLPQRMLPH